MTPLLLTVFLATAQPRTSPQLAADVSLHLPADSTELQAYAGTYAFADGAPISQYVIKVENGNLYGEADSYGPNKLLKQPQADTFQSTSQYASILTFQRDPVTKQITGFTLQISGQELKATRKK